MYNPNCRYCGKPLKHLGLNLNGFPKYQKCKCLIKREANRGSFKKGNVYGACLIVFVAVITTLSNTLTHLLPKDFPTEEILFFKLICQNTRICSNSIIADKI
jgi:hypothetical protein